MFMAAVAVTMKMTYRYLSLVRQCRCVISNPEEGSKASYSETRNLDIYLLYLFNYMFANVLRTFLVLRFTKTMMLKFDVIVQILPSHASIRCANRRGLSKYCFNPSQCSPRTSTRSTVLIPQLCLVCMFTSHLNTVTMERTNKQTDRRQKRIMILLWNKSLFYSWDG